VKPRALYVDLVLVSVMALAVTALNVHWAMLNQAPPASDDNSHLYSALELLGRVAAMPGGGRGLSLLALYPNHYPPLAYQATLIAYGLFGVAPWVPIASFFPFLLVLASSMYGIGRGLAGRAVGLVCALAGLCAPVVLDLSRTYFLDMPSTAMLAFSLCALLYSRNFSSRPWSAAFGLSMALGVLSKWTHPVFILPFLAVGVYLALRDMYRERWPAVVVALLSASTLLLMTLYILSSPRRDDNTTFDVGPDFHWGGWLLAAAAILVVVGRLQRTAAGRPHLRPFANYVEAFAIAATLAWPWYYFNGEKVREKIVYQAGIAVNMRDALFYYLGDLSSMLYFAPILVICGIAVGLRVPRLRLATVLLVLSTLIGVVLAALLPPDSRYVMPVIVFVVPLGLVWTSTLAGPWKGLQAAVLCLVSAACVWQATAFEWRSHGLARADGPLRTRVEGAYLGLLPVLPALPEGGRYPFGEVLDALRARTRDGWVWVAVLEGREDAARFQPRSFLYQGALHGMKLIVIETTDALESGGEAHDVDQAGSFLLIYRDPASGRSLLREARNRGWLDPTAPPVGRFQFSPDFHVDVYQKARKEKR
jgi:4-amino-4-deoxy-L-arabinose transferase-like glycosyltransferase